MRSAMQEVKSGRDIEPFLHHGQRRPLQRCPEFGRVDRLAGALGEDQVRQPLDARQAADMGGENAVGGVQQGGRSLTGR